MIFETGTDQFGQKTYLCPECRTAFLTTLAERKATDVELVRALAWHYEGEHPDKVATMKLGAWVMWSIVFWVIVILLIWWVAW